MMIRSPNTHHGRGTPVAPVGGTWTGDLLVAGDSITSNAYQSAPYRWSLPLARSPVRLAANVGISGVTLDDFWTTYWASQVLAASPPIVMLRLGTNSLALSYATFMSQYQRFTDSLVANGIKGILCAVPPRTGYSSSILAINAGIAALAAANPSMLRFTDDCLDLADGAYVQDATCFGDGVHPNQRGQYRAGVRQAADLVNIFAANDPRITSASDTYYLTPASDQWVKNPFNSGTGGTKGSGITGTVPDFWSVSNTGAGTTAVASIVAADAGDANSTPWLRMDITGLGGADHILTVSTTLGHPALAADLATVKRLDMICEVRFNALDTTNLNRLTMYCLQGSARPGPELNMGLKNNGTITKTALLRSSYARDEDAAAVVSHAANSISFRFELLIAAAQASAVGSIDFRLASVRGQAT